MPSYDDIRDILKKSMKTRDPREEEDEETKFLTEEDLITKTTKQRTTEKKRKCANCTCELSQEKPIAVKSSGCGSCYKGDAFRCSGCPSLGLPPYNPGDEVNFNDMEDDI